MADNNDLAELWQSQKTIELDITELEAKYKWFNAKQRLFFALDWISLLPLVWVYTHMREKLSTFWLLFFVCIGVLAVAQVGYLTWLRRYSLGAQQQSTERYFETMLLKLHNGKKIALFTAWSSVFIFPICIVVAWYAESGEPLKYPMLIKLTVSWVLTMVACLWFFLLRAKKFSREIAELEKWLESAK